jgi:monothiol glutaredoxin
MIRANTYILKSFSLLKHSQIIFKQHATFLTLRRFSLNSKIKSNPHKMFSTSSTEDIHDDFKPKVKQEINDQNVLQIIDDWVKQNDVVIFMKGTRDMPRCGFSNYVVQILNFYKIKNIKVINILENMTVRESVKQYSNWPTYPQLYVKGNLIGGCDIIKEMHENGTFKEMADREGISSSE